MRKSTLEDEILRSSYLIIETRTTCVDIRFFRILLSEFRLWVPLAPSVELEDDGIPIRWRLARCIQQASVAQRV